MCAQGLPRTQLLCVWQGRGCYSFMCSHASGRGEFDGHALWDVCWTLLVSMGNQTQVVWSL